MAINQHWVATIALLSFCSAVSAYDSCGSLRDEVFTAQLQVEAAEDALFNAQDSAAKFSQARGNALNNMSSDGRFVTGVFGEYNQQQTAQAQNRLRMAQRDLQRAHSRYNMNGCTSSGSTIYME